MDKKNIEELLGNYMVVPEIQREYVWGSNKNIVNQFIDSIKDNKEIGRASCRERVSSPV